MPQEIIGKQLAQGGQQFGIVVSRFNDQVTRLLLNGALETLQRHGVEEENLTVVWVPGAFELPVVAEKMARRGDFSAVLALGAVVQGDTDHHEYINHAVAGGLMAVSQKAGLPVLFGVLTCRTMEQAFDRAGGQAGNKGAEAALAAIEMVNVLSELG